MRRRHQVHDEVGLLGRPSRVDEVKNFVNEPWSSQQLEVVVVGTGDHTESRPGAPHSAPDPYRSTT